MPQSLNMGSYLKAITENITRFGKAFLNGLSSRKFLKNPAVVLMLIAALAVGIPVVIARILPILPRKTPDIILITARSLRPDHLNSYGYLSIHTPALNSLAERGVLFRNAYCDTPHFADSFASILSGQDSWTVLSRKGDNITLSESYNSLSRALRKKGYSALAVNDSSVMLERTGFSKDFDVFINPRTETPETIKPPDPTGEGITERALELYKNHKKGQKPVFMWVSYSLPLFPYNIPDDITDGAESHPYDRQILMLDRQVSSLLEGIRKISAGRDPVVIFTATNGQSLNEHEELTHGIFLYNSTVRVPLIITPPVSQGFTREVTTRVRLADITPTILEMAGIRYAEEDFRGRNLLPLMRRKNGAVKEVPVYLISLTGNRDFGWSPAAGVIYKDHKYIDLPDPELYNIDNDPHELYNLAGKEEMKNIEAELKNMLRDHLEGTRPDIFSLLGQGPDPKDQIDLLNRSMSFRTPDPRRALGFYTALMRRDPGNKRFRYIASEILYGMNRLADAQTAALEVIEQDPDHNQTWQLLGLIYQKQGDTDLAVLAYERALSIYPYMPVALNNLAWSYMQKGIEPEKALEYAELANELMPGMASFADTLAGIHSARGDREKAAEYLEKAISLSPTASQREIYEKKLNEILADISNTES